MVEFFPCIPKTPSSVARAVEQKQTVNVILKMSQKSSIVKKEKKSGSFVAGCVGVWASPGGSWRELGTRDRAALGHMLLVLDLQDMSPMTLSTKTPKDFFAKYQLVLHVAKAKMNKVRVFRVTRESAWPFPCHP